MFVLNYGKEELSSKETGELDSEIRREKNKLCSKIEWSKKKSGIQRKILIRCGMKQVKKAAKELLKETKRQAIQKWDLVVEWGDLSTNLIRKRVIETYLDVETALPMKNYKA